MAVNLLTQEDHVRKGTKEEAMFEIYCRHQPKWDCNGSMVFVSPDIVVSNMVNAYLLLKRVQRLMKTNVVMVEGGNVYTLKAPKGQAITPETCAKVQAKNPNAKVLNNLSVQQVGVILQEVRE